MNNCEIGVMYLWTHAVVTLNNTTVGELNLVNASFSDMDIRGTVNKITYQGVEYTLEELKALGL